jgi:alkylhydroperoxidase family enzyme
MTDPAHKLTRRISKGKAKWRDQFPHQLFERLMAEPMIGEAICVLGDTIMSELEDRPRELVALRVSAVRHNLYIWRGHCQIARHLGLTPSEIGRVAVGPTTFTGDDAAVLWTVEHVLANRNVGAATRQALGPARLLTVTTAARFYDLVASVMNDAEPERSATPIDGLQTPAQARGQGALAVA